MNGKLNKLQLEIINAFATVDENELEEFRAYILKYKVMKLQNHLEKVFEEKGVNPDDLLKEHLRTPYENA
jgi:hypothetical protein